MKHFPARHEGGCGIGHFEGELSLDSMRGFDDHYIPGFTYLAKIRAMVTDFYKVTRDFPQEEL